MKKLLILLLIVGCDIFQDNSIELNLEGACLEKNGFTYATLGKSIVKPKKVLD